MKVNIKGLAFVGFAAAIFAASAHADTEQEIAAKKKTVTSQYYAEQTYQTLANKETTKAALTTNKSSTDRYPSNAAITSYVDDAVSASTTATTYTAGTGIDITSNVVTNSGVRSIATGGENDANGTISVDTGGTTAAVSVKGLQDTAFTQTTTTTSLEESAKIPTAGTVKSYVDTTANAKVENEIISGHTTIAPSGAAVASGLATKQPITTAQANFQVGGASGAWKEIATDSYIGIADGETGTANQGKAVITINATTDGALANAAAATGDNSGDYGKLVTAGAVRTYVDNKITNANLTQYEEKANILDDTNNKTIATNSSATDKYPSAKAVVTYVGNQINTALPAGTAGNVLTYSGTAGTVNSLAIDTTVSNTSNLVTSGAVNTAINGLMATYVPANTTCNASTPCALVWAGDAPTWVNMAQ